ncbi:coiled-coil domain-containing protein 186-like isoform X2 [Branchiostoma floridae]|uniref:Coiled-coil domain-containing protein 186-like isoform X2 n=1 Tax=Branchiostoma floridae TaxID=7739 RepID=A0A9J7M0J7_BRAFL|nr:coiled-coil domain-containing protein 186-like isoform X2 [Branchiostoma floridae]
MVVGGQNEMTSTDGVGRDQPQDQEGRCAQGTVQIPGQDDGTGLGIEPTTSQLQTPRQGEATQTSSSEVSGAHNTVIHAGPGSNIYLGHPGSIERTGFGVEHSTEEPSQPPVEYSDETEETETTFDTKMDLTNTEQPAIAGPEPNPSIDPWVRWTPEGKNLHIRLPKEFCSPNIQSSVSPRYQGNEDTPCSHCPEKEAQIKTLRENDRHLQREIITLKDKLQKATSYSDKLVEERNSYISKYNELHDSQIEIYTELARVKEERDKYITENHRMKEEMGKNESIRLKGKDVSASKNFEGRRKMAELEENLKRAKDDVKYWREKSDGQSREFVKVKTNHERVVKGLQKEVNDLQKKMERYQQQVQHLEEELEKNSDSKLMREKVQCELDLQRTRDDLTRAEAEIKRKETDLNGKGRALSRLERKLQLSEHQKIEADNRVRSLEDMVDRKEKKLQYLENRQREPVRRAGVTSGITTPGQTAKLTPGQAPSSLSPRQSLNSISEDEEVTSPPVLNRRKSCPDNKTLRRAHRRETL